MKIKKLNLTAFGGFTEKTFDFSEPNKSFYLIEGPNEAGKSTTLRAIKTALFGFERNAKDDYIHLKENLRVGISLIKGSHELNFIRRRGNKNTIQAADLLVMADNAISQFCSILENKNLFCRMFGLDHQTLVSGGEDILNNGSDAGQSIFEAGSGILGLNNLLNDLKSKAAALFTTGSRSRIIDQLLLSYKSLASEKKQSQLKPEDWEKINSELLNNDEQLRGIVKKIQTLKVESNKLDKDLFLKEQISTIIRLGNELENLKKIKVLPIENVNLRITAIASLEQSNNHLTDANAELNLILTDLGEIKVSTILDYIDSINNLNKRLELYNSNKDKIDLMKKRLEQIDCLIHSSDVNIKAVDIPVFLKSLNIFQIQRLGYDLSQLQDQVKTAGQEIRELKSINENLKVAFSDKSLIDLTSLSAAIETVKENAYLVSKLDSLSSKIVTKKQELVNDIKTKLRVSNNISDFNNIIVTTQEKINDFIKVLNKLRSSIEASETRKGQLQSNLINLEFDYSISVGDKKLYSLLDLKSKREVRDKQWLKVKSIFIDKTLEDINETNNSFGEDTSQSFQSNLNESDIIADYIIKDAELAVKQQTDQLEIEKLKKQIEHLDNDISAKNQELKDKNHEWDLECQNVGIKPIEPEEMNAWLNDYNLVKDSINNLGTELEEERNTREQIDSNINMLRESLNSYNFKNILGTGTLHYFLQLASTVLAEIESDNTVINNIQSNENDLILKVDELTSIKSNFEDILQNYKTKVNELWSCDCLETSFIEGKISSLQKIIDLNKEVGQLNLLLGQNLEYCKQFEDDVDILSKNLIVSYDKIPSYGDIVYNLYETSQIALGNKNKRNNLENSKQTLLRNIAAYEHNIQKAEKAIKKCCSDADIAYENFHLLPELELKSANKLSLDTTIFKLKKELFISEGNKDFDEVNKYLSLIDETSIRSRLSEISEEIQNLENEKDSYNSNHGSIVERRKVLLNNDGSYMLEQDLQSKAADIKSRIKEYFTYLVSIQILEKTIEHYKNIHQHPILNRAGQIFQRLTLGNYIRLVVDYEKDKTILLGVLHNGENLNPTEMSKGTRDQLFLSLRLAAIELYNNSNEPMPILLDDVLIQYDEQRIKAALTVLAEMSSNTQVIFFTHNSNIVRLAKEVIDQEVLKIISLDKTYSIRS